MSEANRVSLTIAEEDGDYGVPTATGNFETISYTSQNVAANPQTTISNTLKSNRMVSDLALVGSQMGGAIQLEAQQGDAFDMMLEGALMGSWASGVLTAGTTERSFSIETGFTDWATPQFLQYLGMRCGGFSLNVAYGSIVTGEFQFGGKEATSTASIAAATSGNINPASTTPVFNGSSGVSVIQIDSSAITTVRTLSLSLTNNLRPIEAIGALGPSDQAAGRSLLSGSVDMYFEDLTQYNKLLNSSSCTINFTLSDGTKTYAFSMGNVKWNDGNPAVTGVDTDVMLSMNFTALEVGSTGTQISITRT